MGVFNIDFLKYDTNGEGETFLDSMYTNFLLSYIQTPIRVTTNSKGLFTIYFQTTLMTI